MQDLDTYRVSETFTRRSECASEHYNAGANRDQINKLTAVLAGALQVRYVPFPGMATKAIQEAAKLSRVTQSRMLSREAAQSSTAL
jgi:hypothetical protein